MKKSTVLFFCFFFLISCGQDVQETSPKEETPTIKTTDSEKTPISLEDLVLGKTVNLGNLNNQPIEWVVKEKNPDGSFMLVSKRILLSTAFDNAGREIEWQSSSLDQYLNNGFYESTFSENEKKHIKNDFVAISKNPKYEKNDKQQVEFKFKRKVFLLGIEEIDRLFAGEDSLVAETVEYPDKHKKASNTWWWLRTNGRNNGKVVFISDSGKIDYSGKETDSKGGVRPAIKYIYDVQQPAAPVPQPESVLGSCDRLHEFMEVCTPFKCRREIAFQEEILYDTAEIKGMRNGKCRYEKVLHFQKEGTIKIICNLGDSDRLNASEYFKDPEHTNFFYAIIMENSKKTVDNPFKYFFVDNVCVLLQEKIDGNCEQIVFEDGHYLGTKKVSCPEAD